MSVVCMPIDAKEANEASVVALKAKAHKWTGVWRKIHAATEAGQFCTSIVLSDLAGESTELAQFIKAMAAFGYTVQPNSNMSTAGTWCWIEWECV